MIKLAEEQMELTFNIIIIIVIILCYHALQPGPFWDLYVSFCPVANSDANKTTTL